ncbi:MAG: hypothetical protein N0A24_09875 [Armatimonadetes bacterium]|nr:hypothetical protein [Armatimonadota bacterium]MDW8154486.1 hypothetical protein [Armatimonadota bacterium]
MSDQRRAMRGALLVILLTALPPRLVARAYEIRTVGGWERELRAGAVVRTAPPKPVFFRLARTPEGRYRNPREGLLLNERCEVLDARGKPTGFDAGLCPVDPDKPLLRVPLRRDDPKAVLPLRRGTVDVDLDGDGVTNERGYMIVTETTIVVVAYSPHTRMLKFDFTRLGDPQKVRVLQTLRRYQVQTLP